MRSWLAKPVALVAIVSAQCLAVPAAAEPWVTPGDAGLRHDLQLLYDGGLLSGPSLSWPLSWPDIARDLDKADAAGVPAGVAAAMARVQHRLQREQTAHDTRLSARVAGAADPDQLRSFAYTPREEAELTVTADWLGDRFAWKLAGTVVADPDDDETFRPDGSYVAASLGNWMLSFGWQERWWGPGWESSLILSSNARPVPAVALERRESLPLDLPVLRALGPWRLVTFMGRLEEDRDYPKALLWGLRAEIRPVPSLQIAASRTAQWCGDGRPCDGGTFWDLLAGNDNDQDLSEQPGNQLAGFDVRWTWPGGRVPLALYAQAIGEDEAGFMPSKYLGQFGAEAWGETRFGQWRAHFEYADTACDFLADPPEFGCAYESGIYTDGYRYRGRAIGHAIDTDGESIGFGGMLISPDDGEWRILARNVKLNRAGASYAHSLADGPARVLDVELVHRRAFAWGSIEGGVGYADVSDDGGVAVRIEDGFRGHLSWQHEWR